jgi:D-glycero-D-manno-heptose 1,7-bisphosphate phosphatase
MPSEDFGSRVPDFEGQFEGESVVTGGIVRLLFSRPLSTGGPAVFLDRDGVINERIHDGYVTEWSSFQLVPGIIEAVRALSELELPIVILSNQAGVGRGLLSRRQLVQITRRFVEAFRKDGARIDAVYYCPHAREAHCPCRKPRTGLFEQAARDWGTDLQRSVFVGDSPSDVEAANGVGCRAVLFSTEEHPVGSVPWETILVGRASEIYPVVSKLLK